MKRKNKEVNIFNMSALDLFASAMGAFILIAVIALPYYLKTDKLLEEQFTELKIAFADEQQKLSASMEANKKLEQKMVQLKLSLDEAENKVKTLEEELSKCLAQKQQLKLSLEESENKVKTLESKLSQCLTQKQQLESSLAETENKAKACQKKLADTFIAVVMQWPGSKIDIDLHVVDPRGQEFSYSKDNRDGRDFPNSKARLSRDTTRGPGVEVWEVIKADVGTYKIYYSFHSRNGGANKTEVSAFIYTNKGSHEIPKITLTDGVKKLVGKITITVNGDVIFN